MVQPASSSEQSWVVATKAFEMNGFTANHATRKSGAALTMSVCALNSG